MSQVTVKIRVRVSVRVRVAVSVRVSDSSMLKATAMDPVLDITSSPRALA